MFLKISVGSVATMSAGEQPSSVRIGQSSHGQGAFATASIEIGSLIGYYSGEVLAEAAYADRYDGRPPHEAGYVYFLRGGGTCKAGVLVIDARSAELSSWARFINSPFGTVLRSNVRWGRHLYAGGCPRVEIRASRKLKIGDELLIDYGRDYPWFSVLSHAAAAAP
jgi:hypothetical protein